MKVILKFGEVAEVNDSYGARLIEQGKAILAPLPAVKKPAPKAAAPAPEKKG